MRPEFFNSEKSAKDFTVTGVFLYKDELQ